MAGAESLDSGDWASATRLLESLAVCGGLQASRTTAMEILRRTHLEGDHRSMIAWLLNPSGEHGLGTTLLAALLRRTGRPDLAEAANLSSIVVTEEYDLPSTEETKHRRADIVVQLAGTVVVIELKIHSKEHSEQTPDLAAHFAHHREPHFIFLTLSGEKAEHGDFVPHRLVTFAGSLREQLALAPPADGRATAADYLATLEGMNAVTTLDEARARFWIRKEALDQGRARRAAFELLEALPERVAAGLDVLRSELGPDVVLRTFEDHPKGYTERVTLLLRHSWNVTSPVAGIGFGFRLVSENDPDRLLRRNKPFYGIWLNSHDKNTNWPRIMQQDHWSHWADWEYLGLHFKDTDTDLPSLYAARVADHVRDLWRAYAAQLDRTLGGEGQ